MQINAIQNRNYNNITFEQKYRVILTMNCPRACKDCINTFDEIKLMAKKDVFDLKNRNFGCPADEKLVILDA